MVYNFKLLWTRLKGWVLFYWTKQYVQVKLLKQEILEQSTQKQLDLIEIKINKFLDRTAEHKKEIDEYTKLLILLNEQRETLPKINWDKL